MFPTKVQEPESLYNVYEHNWKTAKLASNRTIYLSVNYAIVSAQRVKHTSQLFKKIPW